jgi:hypothetical protein
MVTLPLSHIDVPLVYYLFVDWYVRLGTFKMFLGRDLMQCQLLTSKVCLGTSLCREVEGMTTGYSWDDLKLSPARVCAHMLEWSAQRHLSFFRMSSWGCVLGFWRFLRTNYMCIPPLGAEAEAQSEYGVVTK